MPVQVLSKLYPWEWMVREAFGQHVLTDTTAFIEPAWKMILSNKMLLPLLWERLPRPRQPACRPSTASTPTSAAAS